VPRMRKPPLIRSRKLNQQILAIARVFSANC
jgi:hypothetical protein